MKKNGFTLVELLAVIVILGILVGIGIPVYFNISKNVKENEYQAKVKQIEVAAVKYAEDFEVEESGFTAARLIANGYLSADKYVEEQGTQIPFISNPKDENDNLVCHVITINKESYEYSAVFNDKNSNCSYTVEDMAFINSGIKAYEFESGRIIKSLPINADTKETMWTNKNVILIINPNEEYNNIVINFGSKNQLVDPKNMLDYNRPDLTSVINPENYSNTVVVSAENILKQEVNFSLENNEGISTTSITVRIDKEAPFVNSEKFNGWTSSNKGTIIYISDGNGSGPKRVCVTENDSFSENHCYGADKDGIAYIGGENYSLSNGTYYLWPEDKAGNRATKSTAIEIKNVDDKAPSLQETKWEIDSDISNKVTGEQNTSGIIKYDRLRIMKTKIVDGESGLKDAKYCVTTDERCEPNISVNLNNGYFEFDWDPPVNGKRMGKKEAQRICFDAEDNVGNKISDNGNTNCTGAYFVDGSPAELRNFEFDGLRGFDFVLEDKESGVYKYEAIATRRDKQNEVKSCSGNIDDFYSTDKRNCAFKYLTADKDYDVKFTFYNRANIKSEPTDTFHTYYKVDTGYKLCQGDKNGNWCIGDDGDENGNNANNGIFVRYGSLDFVLYKKENNSVYGTSLNNKRVMTSLIDTQCCDRSMCRPEYIFGDNSHFKASGIYDSTKKSERDGYTNGFNLRRFFESLLPDNRIKVADRQTFKTRYIDSEEFKNGLIQDDNPIAWSPDSIPDVMYKGYVYTLPSHYEKANDSSAKCYKKGSSAYTNGQTPKIKYNVGTTITIICSRKNGTDTFSKDVRIESSEDEDSVADKNYQPSISTDNSFHPNLSFNSDNDKMVLYEPPEFNEEKPYRKDKKSGVTNEKGKVIKSYHRIYSTFNDHFGLLEYDEYVKLKNSDYFKKINGGNGISTLLSTYVKGVVYQKKDFERYWRSAYGHDGAISQVSAIYADMNGYYPITPMMYGINYASMVIPFNPEVKFIDGTGQENDPFIITSESDPFLKEVQ